MATDIDQTAVACARTNGVDARLGDLFAPVLPLLAGRVDVVVGVVPYVPTPELRLLQRDTFAFDTALGSRRRRRRARGRAPACSMARAVCRSGGALLLEVGGDQPELLAGDLARLGYRDAEVLRDEEGDARGIEATRLWLLPGRGSIRHGRRPATAASAAVATGSARRVRRRLDDPARAAAP